MLTTEQMVQELNKYYCYTEHNSPYTFENAECYCSEQVAGGSVSVQMIVDYCNSKNIPMTHACVSVEDDYVPYEDYYVPYVYVSYQRPMSVTEWENYVREQYNEINSEQEMQAMADLEEYNRLKEKLGL